MTEREVGLLYSAHFLCITKQIGRAFGHDLIFLYIIVNLFSLCSFAQFEPAHCLFVDLIDQCANAFGSARELLVRKCARR